MWWYFLLMIILGIGINSNYSQTLHVIWKKALQVPPQKNCRIPQFSPDGRFIAFEVRDNENVYLYLYEIATDKYVQLGGNNFNKQGGRFGLRASLTTTFTGSITFWEDTEEGTLLFDFIHTPYFGQRYLYQGDISPNEGINKFINQSINNLDLFFRFDNLDDLPLIRNPAFTHGILADIPWVAFTDRQNIYVFNHGEYDKPIQLTNPRGVWADMHPKFSPDDRSLIFVRDSRENTDIGLIKLRLQGTALKKVSEKLILNTPAIEVSPEWSADGEKIAYYSDEGHTRNFSIWIYHINTGQKIPVVQNVVLNSYRARGPAWVGNRGLVFVRRDIKKGFPIYYFDLYSRREILIPTNTINNLDPAVWMISEKEFLLVFATGGSTTSEEQYIWTKLFLAKIRIED